MFYPASQVVQATAKTNAADAKAAAAAEEARGRTDAAEHVAEPEEELQAAEEAGAVVKEAARKEAEHIATHEVGLQAEVESREVAMETEAIIDEEAEAKKALKPFSEIEAKLKTDEEIGAVRSEAETMPHKQAKHIAESGAKVKITEEDKAATEEEARDEAEDTSWKETDPVVEPEAKLKTVDAKARTPLQ